MSQRDYDFNFDYLLQRGDVCVYCGTIFGYDMKSSISGSSTDGYWGACKRAIVDAKKICVDAAELKACPHCGRIPSEAFATEFTLRSIGVGAIAGPIGGFVAFALAWSCVKLFEISGLESCLGACFAVGCAATAAVFAYKFADRYELFFQKPNPKKQKKRVGLRAETLGVCSEIELGRELKGRLAFQFLGATRIAATLLTGFAGAAAGLGGLRLLETVPLDAFRIAAYVVLGVLIVAVVCAGRVGCAAVRFQGARHFGCGWEYAASFRAEAEQKLSSSGQERARSLLAQLQWLERMETARTIAILRAATELTSSGVAMLRIAEAEAGVVSSCASVGESNQEATSAETAETAETVETAKFAKIAATADEEFDAARRRLSRYDR